MKEILNNSSEYEILGYLKNIYRSKESITFEDYEALKNYETEDYALLGIIGLLIDSNARILLGMKQPYDTEVQEWCRIIEVPIEFLEKVAEQYLDDDYSEETEFILRKVMLEYPKKTIKFSDLAT